MIVVLTFKADIGDSGRFKKSESVSAYYGMTPRQYSSGETVRQGGISRCGAKEMRRGSCYVINTLKIMEFSESLGNKTDA